jgi:hypothetical protein
VLPLKGRFYLSTIVAAGFLPIQLFRNSAFVPEIFSEIREENRSSNCEPRKKLVAYLLRTAKASRSEQENE